MQLAKPVSSEIRQELAVPPSSLALDDAVKYKKKKRRRKMKPDANPNEDEPSTDNFYGQQETAECNGFFEGSADHIPEAASQLPEVEQESKHIQDFVQDFVHSTVAEAQMTLGRLLNGCQEADATEDSSLSMMSITDSLCEDSSHYESSLPAVELYIGQLLRDIVSDALSKATETEDSRQGKDDTTKQTDEGTSRLSKPSWVETFADDLLTKVYDDVKKGASPSRDFAVANKDFLRVQCSKKTLHSPPGEGHSDFHSQKESSGNSLALEKSDYMENLVSSIISSAIVSKSVLEPQALTSQEIVTGQQDNASSAITQPNISEPPESQPSAQVDKKSHIITLSSNINLSAIPEEQFIVSPSVDCSPDVKLTSYVIEAPHNTPMADVNVSEELEERYMADPSNNWLSHTDALIKETEIELNRLQSKVLNADQSIYKLAYDEASTDVSEGEESSEPSVPNVIDRYVRDRSEIIVHELDTGSEAGSEDVELLPHRYDVSSGLDKHLYVNKLSLATELLRTKETIPYDEEFKMVVKEGETREESAVAGRVNDGFEEELGAVADNRKSNISIIDSGVQSDESEDEAEAKGAHDFPKETGEETQEVENGVQTGTNGGYRRFGGRTFGVLKGTPFPCWCCNVM